MTCPRIFLALIFLLSTTLLPAQQNDIDVTKGLYPYGSFLNGEFDSVDMTNGNLNVHIPLVSFPQRGKVRLDFGIVWNAKNWMMSYYPSGNADNIGKWYYGLGDSTPAGVQVLKQQSLYYQFHTATVSAIDGGTTVHETVDLEGVTTPDGAYHEFRQQSSSFANNIPAIDGSGISPILDAANWYVIGAYDQEGVKYTWPTQHRVDTQDSNGNKIVTSDWGWTDTVGRFIPGTTTDASGATVAPDLIPGVPSGDVSNCLPGTAAARRWDLPGPQGTTSTYTLCYADVPYQTAFDAYKINAVWDGISEASGTTRVLQQIVQPDNTTWTFSYDSYLCLTRIQLPTGGIISYEWGNVSFNPDSQVAPVSRALLRRTVDANDGTGGQPWGYSWSPIDWHTAPFGASWRDIVTDPDGNDEVHYIGFYTTHIQYFQGGCGCQDGHLQGTLLKTVEDDPVGIGSSGFNYGGGSVGRTAPGTVTTIWPNGKVSRVVYTYDASDSTFQQNLYDFNDYYYVVNHSEPTTYPFNIHFGNRTKVSEYDYGDNTPGVADAQVLTPGPLKRVTTTVYKWTDPSDTAQNYKRSNLADLPLSVTVTDGAGNICAKTKFGYDETAPDGSGLGPGQQLYAPPGPARGNQTTVSQWLSQTPCTSTSEDSGTYISGTNTYYDSGMVKKSTDPRLHHTDFGYSGFNGAYVTQKCDPMGHCVSFDYDLNTGLLASFTDQNTNKTSYTYDSMWRTATVSFPDGGSKAITYTPPTKVEVLLRIDSVNYPDDSFIYFDGLGRVFKAVHNTSDGSATVKTNYDNVGRPKSVTNPYYVNRDSTTDAPPDGITTTVEYDALGRVKTVTKQDKGTVSSEYAANCVTVTDEAQKSRKSCVDGLGRLVEVDEPGVATPGTPASSVPPGITVSGPLRSSTAPATSATYATGWVTINGSDKTQTTITKCTLIGRWGTTCDNTGDTSIDTGKVCVTIGSLPSYCYTFGTGTSPDTAANVAANLAGQIHGGTSPVDAWVDPSNSAKIDLQARTAGAAGNNITFSSSPTSSVDFYTTNSGSTVTNGADATPSTTTYDAGVATISGPGFTGQACYGTSSNAQCTGQTTTNTTAAQVAAALASSLNTASSPVTATATDTAVIIQYKNVGQVGNGSVTVASQPDNSTLFPGGSFSGSGSLTGGTDPDPSGLSVPFVTLYGYDPVGNLLGVEQLGGTGDQTQWRQRSFQYDSLSRLTSSYNPEAGTITYKHDDDGLLIERDRPRANQFDPTLLTVTTYGYDPDHHLTAISYNDTTGTNAVFNYGETAVAGLSISNPVDRLTSQSNGVSSDIFRYDSMGRVGGIRTTIGAVTKDIGYTYNFDGSLSTLMYPSRAVVTYTPDSARRLLSAVDNGSAINYVTQATYNAAGQITGFINSGSTTASGISREFHYNDRMQPISYAASTPAQTFFSIGYDFHIAAGDNGNVWQRLNNLDPTRTQIFTYDLLNRLSSAKTVGTDCTQTLPGGQAKFWGTSYGYDPWGNLLSKSVTQCSAIPLSVTVDAANRLIGYTYDAAGNLLNTGAGPAIYSYDAESRITSVPGYSYGYDAGENRISKSAGGVGTLYWYGTRDILAESDLAGNIQSEYVFFGGNRLARRDNTGAVYYLFSDYLKSINVITDAAGNVLSDSDYGPWGEEQTFRNGTANHFKFNGKIRDDETGLDNFEARYYGSTLGRFLSPDWSGAAEPVPYARLWNPQSLNLYSYVWNNPESLGDDSGHTPGDATSLINCTGAKPDPRCKKRAKKRPCEPSGTMSCINPMLANGAPTLEPYPITPLLPRVPLLSDNKQAIAGCLLGGELSELLNRAGNAYREKEWKVYYDKHPGDPLAIAHKQLYEHMPPTVGEDMSDPGVDSPEGGSKTFLRYTPFEQRQNKNGKTTGKKLGRTQQFPMQSESGQAKADGAAAAVEGALARGGCLLLLSYPSDDPPED